MSLIKCTFWILEQIVWLLRSYYNDMYKEVFKYLWLYTLTATKITKISNNINELALLTWLIYIVWHMLEKWVLQSVFAKLWTLFNICICYIYLCYLGAFCSPPRELCNELKYVQNGVEMNEVSCLKVRHVKHKNGKVPHRSKQEVNACL